MKGIFDIIAGTALGVILGVAVLALLTVSFFHRHTIWAVLAHTKTIAAGGTLIVFIMAVVAHRAYEERAHKRELLEFQKAFDNAERACKTSAEYKEFRRRSADAEACIFGGAILPRRTSDEERRRTSPANCPPRPRPDEDPCKRFSFRGLDRHFLQ